MEKAVEWNDDELGRLCVHQNLRARRIIFRYKEDAFYVTVPYGTDLKTLRLVIEKSKAKLLALKEKMQHQTMCIDWNYKIDADLFKLRIVKGEGKNFRAQERNGWLEIVCPATTDFSNLTMQNWLVKTIENLLRRKATCLLPTLLQQQATQCKLSYAGVKINTSRGRWGSCSSLKQINLSCFLLLLPIHLINYVLQHELCHTKHMNHSAAFWAELDKLAQGKSNQYKLEIKKYRTSIL